MKNKLVKMRMNQARDVRAARYSSRFNNANELKIENYKNADDLS
jgi:hypothetical protein